MFFLEMLKDRIVSSFFFSFSLIRFPRPFSLSFSLFLSISISLSLSLNPQISYLLPPRLEPPPPRRRRGLGGSDPPRELGLGRAACDARLVDVRRERRGVGGVAVGLGLGGAHGGEGRVVVAAESFCSFFFCSFE